MIQFACGENVICAQVGELPLTYDSMVQHATLHDDLRIAGMKGTLLVVTAAAIPMEWPQLVVSLEFEPGPEAGFNPGLLLVPERSILFIGAGERLLAYDLRTLRRLWKDEADTGFWCWRRHGDLVLMSAELELAAWTIDGKKLWSTFVEPPWTYRVQGEELHLDVMGAETVFPVHEGRDKPRP